MSEAAQVTLALVPHVDLECLLLEPPAGESQAWHVCNTLTGERQALPDSEHDWELQYSEGFAYVDNGEDSIWVQPLLDMGLYQHEGQVYLVKKGSTMTLWAWAKEEHSSKTLQLAFGHPTRQESFVLNLYDFGNGSFFRWRLTDLYHSLNLKICGGRSYTWAAKRCVAWSALQSAMGLPAGHLKKPVLQDEASDAVPRASHWASTPLWLAIVARSATMARSIGGGRFA